MRTAQGTLSVFTFKDGILARAAHDLALRLEGLAVTLDGDTVTATAGLRGMVAIGPVEDGRIRADEYDPARRAEIERTLHAEVLDSARHPTARFDGRAIARGDGFTVTGQLALAGVRAPLTFAVERDGNRDRYRGHFALQPSRWGIAPYRALLGAIKLKDLVRVELVVEVGAHQVLEL